MSIVKSQLVNCHRPQDSSYRCPSEQEIYGKFKTGNETKTQFVKLNQKSRLKKGLGHSQMLTNNFSRRNSGATTISNVSSSTSSTLKTTASTRTTNNSASKCSTHKSRLSCVQPQKSWSLPHIDNDNDTKKSNKYEFTEQRRNYERMTQQLQQQRSWSSEQLIRCNISNSRIPTCSIVQHQHNELDNDDHDNDDKIAMKLTDGDAINAEFLALREFRLNNSKDCFGDRHHQELYLMRTQTPEILTSNKVKPDSTDHQSYDTNWWLGPNCKQLKEKLNVSKSSMPYAIRQRLLREQLAKELPNNAKRTNEFKNMGLNKSLALTYQSMY